MRFWSHLDAIHLAQLLSDLIVLQRTRVQLLWLISFDVNKCFHTLQCACLLPQLSAALRQRFRYGQVDGSDRSIANVLSSRSGGRFSGAGLP